MSKYHDEEELEKYMKKQMDKKSRKDLIRKLQETIAYIETLK